MIERWMLSAIQEGKDFKRDNTEVQHVYFPDAQLRRTYVRLHGSTIAIIYPDRIEASDCSYQTPTTKSRLNAVLRLCSNGAGVYQKSFKWYRSDNDEMIPLGSTQIFAR